METDLVLDLFDEFAQRFARGESPAVLEYIERAGERGDELANMLNRFLASAPPPQPSAERVEMMRAWIAGPAADPRAAQAARPDARRRRRAPARPARPASRAQSEGARLLPRARDRAARAPRRRPARLGSARPGARSERQRPRGLAPAPHRGDAGLPGAARRIRSIGDAVLSAPMSAPAAGRRGRGRSTLHRRRSIIRGHGLRLRRPARA